MNAAQHLLVATVQFYRWVLSPLKRSLFGPLGLCRFTPTCSAYALEAIRRHGACRGSWLAARRLLRCHPWGECGHDPVPNPSPRRDPSAISAFATRPGPRPAPLADFAPHPPHL